MQPRARASFETAAVISCEVGMRRLVNDGTRAKDFQATSAIPLNPTTCGVPQVAARGNTARRWVAISWVIQEWKRHVLRRADGTPIESAKTRVENAGPCNE
jgi:hypothetical protein